MGEILASPAFGITQRRESTTVPRLKLVPFVSRALFRVSEVIQLMTPISVHLPEKDQFRSGYPNEICLRSQQEAMDTSRGYLDGGYGHKLRVTMKMLKPPLNNGVIQTRESTRWLMREARVWTKLRHSNILPFIGLFDIGEPIPILISPFCGFGHIGGYLEILYALTYPPACIDCDETAPQCGGRVEENVLIDKRGVACIGDYGMFKIMDLFDFPLRPTTVYTAPELSAVLQSGHGTISGRRAGPTKMSDVYSLGLLMILAARRLSHSVLSAITQTSVEAFLRTRAQYGVEMISSSMSTILVQCWNFHPQLRPAIAEILEAPPVWGLRR
ncbi:kinase-like domain-containing protein [Mycena olivaceomarginata]|nr:kinase-like domain-containing protein [Mycena olivaceomarginata]